MLGIPLFWSFVFREFEIVPDFEFRHSNLKTNDYIYPLRGGYLMPPALREEPHLPLPQRLCRNRLFAFICHFDPCETCPREIGERGEKSLNARPLQIQDSSAIASE